MLGMDYLQCQANSCTGGSHKHLHCSGFHRSQLTNSWRCPPHGGPSPPHRASITSTTCDNCQQPIRAGIRPRLCATPDCPRPVHSAKCYSTVSAHQGRWLCRQHRQLNHLSETFAGRPVAQIQQQEPNHPARRSCRNCTRNIACNIKPLTCSS